MKNPFKRKYRVLEVRMGDNTARFYPQSRTWYWRWIGFAMPTDSSTQQVYYDIAAANEVIADLHKEIRKGKIVSTEAHEFDEVFYELKKSAGEHTDPCDECDSCRV